MTAYDPTNNASQGATPEDPTGEIRGPAQDSDATAAGNPPAGGSTPQLAEPFWREQTSHIEAPLYRGDEPVIQPAANAAQHADAAQNADAAPYDQHTPYDQHAQYDQHTQHDPWVTGPVSGTSASAAYPSPPSPWSGAEAPGPTFSAPLQSPAYGSPSSGLPQAPADNVSKPKRLRSAIIGTAVAAALIGGATGAGTVALENRSSTTSASSVLSTTGSTAPTSAVTNGTVSAAAAKITPSVVTIQVVGSNESGTGSGVIVRSDGYILTNNHVVSVAGTGGSITVQTSDGRSAKATIVGTDSTDDLAVIKVTGLTNLTAATFAKSSALTVGQSVVAIGAPLGLSDTVTSGIVSATARTVRSGDDNAAVFAAVQTDAAINPGNSGGALVDLNGNVIGINAAIASTSSSGVTVPGQQETQSGNIGIGFAIPSDEASRIANELISTGKATHAVLGVEVTSSTSTTSTGATLRSVTAGGAAAAAGLKAGDVVTKVDGSRISEGDDLIAAIRAHAVKDTVTVTYTRAGAVHTTKVTLTSATS